MLASCSEAIFLVDYVSSQKYVNVQRFEKRKLDELLCLEVVAIPGYSIFVAHGYLQCGGCDWRGSHYLHNGTSLILPSFGLKNLVALSTGWSLL